MTAYVALLDGGKREETVEVRQLGPRRYTVSHRGRTHEVDAFEHDFGTVSLLVDTESYSVQLDQRAAAMRVQVRGEVHPIEILDERRLRMRRVASRSSVAGREELVARLSGRVVKVLAGVGEGVREGQGLVVVEALGMHNVMRSPKDGALVELRVAEGQTIEGGAVIAAVE
jgi:biotin carboxyl carrier protein